MSESTDPLFGRVWNMVADRSSFSTSFVPQVESRHYEQVPGGYKLTVSGEHDGTAYEWYYTARYDGNPHPVYGRKDVDSIVIYKLDARNTVGLFMKQLSPGGPYARTVSVDGRTLVVQAAGRHSDGSPFFDVIEYEL